MPKPFHITIKRTGRPSVVVAGEFTDDESIILERYLEQFDRLANAKPFREGVPLQLSINVSQEGTTKADADLPDDDTVDIMLQRLRPFILQNQYASFTTVVKILKRRISDVQVRQMLDEQSQLYDGRDSRRTMTLTSNDVVVNSEKVLGDWLNAHEYHADPKKRETIDTLFARLSTPVLRAVLVGMLLDKADAIQNVASYIALLFGRVDSINVQSTDIRPTS